MPQNNKFTKRIKSATTVPWITQGTVIDTNDPQQMGRVRALCPALGDREDMKLTDVPWCSYVSPFGGTTFRGGKGPENLASAGPVSYGMWAIPKVGAYVLVMCLDGNSSYRVWMGCMYGQFLPHTMPTGRWSNDQGPTSTTEQPIQPISNNANNAFNNDPSSFEWKTRVAENQVAGVTNEVLDKVRSEVSDERNDSTNRRGYQQSRIRPDFDHPLKEKTGNVNLDSQMYTITTPGLHSFIMDDSIDNGRIRIKSTSGNQVILDDTNERIYISTSSGENYIEMDKSGNIDVYSSRRVSIHAEKDINLTSREAIRMSAKNIHMRTSEDIRMHSETCLSFEAPTTVIESGTTTISGVLTVGTQVDVPTLNVNDAIIGTGDIGTANITTTNTSTINAVTQNITGPAATHNGAGPFLLMGSASAPSVDSPSFTALKPVRITATSNRVPIHEPWGRIMVSLLESDTNSSIAAILAITNTSSVLEISYTDENVGKIELGESILRNINWRR